MKIVQILLDDKMGNLMALDDEGNVWTEDFGDGAQWKLHLRNDKERIT